MRFDQPRATRPPHRSDPSRPVDQEASEAPAPEAILARAVRGGKQRVVDNYAGAGPIELWGIEMAIRGVVAEIEWKKK